MPYQKFGSKAGLSDSAKKLECLNLPPDMTGMGVLDIGCAEGFFCMESLNRGAQRVVGIDSQSGRIAKAKQQVPGAEFIEQDWYSLPRGPFDVVLLLSTLMYERQPRFFLQRIAREMAAGGLLVVEAGVAAGSDLGTRWTERPKGAVFHPTLRTLVHDYLRGFEVVHVGRSIDQPLDPVPRHVFHCSKRPTTVLCHNKFDDGGQRPTMWSSDGIPRVDVDMLVEDLCGASTIKPAVRDVLWRWAYGGAGNKKLATLLSEVESFHWFVGVVVEQLPLETDRVAVEGRALSSEFLSELARSLGREAVVVNATTIEAAGGNQKWLSRVPGDEGILVSSKSFVGRELLEVTPSEGSDIQTLTEEIEKYRSRVHILESRLQRLRSRKAVRCALGAAAILRPVLQRMRKGTGVG